MSRKSDRDHCGGPNGVGPGLHSFRTRHTRHWFHRHHWRSSGLHPVSLSPSLFLTNGATRGFFCRLTREHSHDTRRQRVHAKIRASPWFVPRGNGFTRNQGVALVVQNGAATVQSLADTGADSVRSCWRSSRSCWISASIRAASVWKQHRLGRSRLQHLGNDFSRLRSNVHHLAAAASSSFPMAEPEKTWAAPLYDGTPGTLHSNWSRCRRALAPASTTPQASRHPRPNRVKKRAELRKRGSRRGCGRKGRDRDGDGRKECEMKEQDE